MDNEENNKRGFGYFMFHASKRPELYNQVGRILYREAGIQSAELNCLITYIIIKADEEGIR